MAVNLHVEVGIEPTGDGMRAVRVFNMNLRCAFAGRLLATSDGRMDSADNSRLSRTDSSPRP